MTTVAEDRWAVAGFEPAPTPPYESERLDALHDLGLLDTPPTECFDQVTRLAAKALDIPIVLVSLVDEHRQWFKSKVGVDVTQTTRSVSFCAHVIVNLRPLIVRDAAVDLRFAANPLVLNAPFIRAYAGMPLFTQQGHAVGTLCAIDQKPREFDEEELKLLRDCTSLVQGFLYAHELALKAQSVLTTSKQRESLFRDTFEQAAVGIIHISLSGELLRVNQRLCDWLGYTAFELRTLAYLDLTHPEDIETSSELMESIVAGAIDDYCVEKRYLKKDGSPFWVYLSMALTRSAAGRPEYFIAVVEDITVRKQRELDLIRARDTLADEFVGQTERLHKSNAALRIQLKKLLESEEKLRHAEGRLRSFANCLPTLMSYWNRDLVCEFANEAHRDWFTTPPEQIVGMHLSAFLGEEIIREVRPHTQRALAGQTTRYERAAIKLDGSETLLETRFHPDVGDSGQVAGFFAFVTDMSEVTKSRVAVDIATAELAAERMTDQLTGVGNRPYLVGCGTTAARHHVSQGEMYGVILLRIDEFRGLNEMHGFAVADAVLNQVGGLLKGQLRGQRDVIARIGNAEFAILCFGALDEDLMRLMGEGIRTQLRTESWPAGTQPTVSCGLAVSSAGDVIFEDVYGRAEAALEQAKAAGRNGTAFAAGGQRTVVATV